MDIIIFLIVIGLSWVIGVSDFVCFIWMLIFFRIVVVCFVGNLCVMV